MTWVDRLATRYRGLIALVRAIESLRADAAVMLLMLMSLSAHPIALARDMSQVFDVVLSVMGVE